MKLDFLKLNYMCCIAVCKICETINSLKYSTRSVAEGTPPTSCIFGSASLQVRQNYNR